MTPEQLEKAIDELKLCCDREWHDESPITVMEIAGNGLLWRSDEIQSLREKLSQKDEALKPLMQHIYKITAASEVVIEHKNEEIKQKDAVIEKMRECLERYSIATISAEFKNGEMKHFDIGQIARQCLAEINSNPEKKEGE